MADTGSTHSGTTLPSGERRQVTVLFTDMVGFTSISERLGEEGTFALIQPIYELMAAAVKEQGGSVKDFTGDGIMALFGVPDALEDAPLRACRAALVIHQRLAAAAPAIEGKHGVRPGFGHEHVEHAATQVRRSELGRHRYPSRPHFWTNTAQRGRHLGRRLLPRQTPSRPGILGPSDRTDRHAVNPSYGSSTNSIAPPIVASIDPRTASVFFTPAPSFVIVTKDANMTSVFYR